MMKNFEKKFIKSVKKINPNQDKMKKTYNLITEKQFDRGIKYLRKGFACCCIVVLAFFCIVYADEIKESITSFRIEYSKKTDNRNDLIKVYSDSIVEINYDANIPETNKLVTPEEYTIEELEKLLSIKLLKSEYFENNSFTQDITEKVDGKISRAIFKNDDLMNIHQKEYHGSDYKVEKIIMSIELVTKYFQDNNGNNGIFPNVDYSEEYFIKSLKEKSLIINYNKSSFVVMFEYDNIRYHFKVIFSPYWNYEEGEMINRIYEILESLSY